MNEDIRNIVWHTQECMEYAALTRRSFCISKCAEERTKLLKFFLDYNEMLTNLTNVQKRCTQLLEEKRAIATNDKYPHDASRCEWCHSK